MSAQRFLYRIDVANRDYHYLSQFEIDGAKRIYQHLPTKGFTARISEAIGLTSGPLACLKKKSGRN